MFSAELALTITLKIIGIATVISTLELIFLAHAREFEERGIWDWTIIRSATSPRSDLVNPIFRRRMILPLLLAVRAVLGVCGLFVAWGSIAALTVIALLFVIQLMLNTRLIYGDDGSDQMVSIALAAIFLASISGSNAIAVTLCLCFLAVQGTLSYVCSGVAKCFGKQWRDGSALSVVLGNYTYGHKGIHSLLVRYGMVGRAITWTIVGFQLCFALFWLTPEPWHLVWLVAGLSFHVGIAYSMRLNGFLFAFPSSYPALVYAHSLT